MACKTSHSFKDFNKESNKTSIAVAIKIPPTISVNQCTPDINLPTTVNAIISNIKILRTFVMLLLNNLLLIKIELPHIHIVINV